MSSFPLRCLRFFQFGSSFLPNFPCGLFHSQRLTPKLQLRLVGSCLRPRWVAGLKSPVFTDQCMELVSNLARLRCCQSTWEPMCGRISTLVPGEQMLFWELKHSPSRMCDYQTLSKGVYKKTQNLPMLPYLTKATVPANRLAGAHQFTIV